MNVATRLEGLAEPGGICVARNVHNQVRGKLALPFEPMGQHRVKNIAEPVEVWRVVLEEATPKRRPWRAPARARFALAAAALALVLTGSGLVVWKWTAAPVLTAANSSERDVLAMPTGPSIAVLPFDSYSRDPEQEYFADGIVEDILTRLSRFSDLKVIGRNATFQYKDQPVDVRVVGKDLGARYVLEGSVRRSGDTVRITVQLLDAEDASHVWAETYDRQLTAANVFGIQDEIVQGVVSALGGAYGVLNRTALEEAKTDNLDAIDACSCPMRTTWRTLHRPIWQRGTASSAPSNSIPTMPMPGPPWRCCTWTSTTCHGIRTRASMIRWSGR